MRELCSDDIPESNVGGFHTEAPQGVEITSY